MLPKQASIARKILVVDDAPQNLKLLRVILKDAGYAVIEATNGSDALAKLRAERPQAMVLDVRMPGMNGYEVCQAVRADPAFAALPVIMLTALSQPDERIRGIEAGATDFISKPFNKRELLARIQTSLALAEAGTGAMMQTAEALLIVRPDWKLLALSAPAALLLGVETGETFGLDILALLQARGAALPEHRGALDDTPLCMELSSPDSPALAACVSPIHDGGHRLIARAVTLTQRSA